MWTDLKPSTSSIHNNLASPGHELHGYSASGRGELLSRLCRVRIGGRVRIDERDKGIRGAGKDSGFAGRNQVSLEGIRFRWKESGFVGTIQVSLEGIRFPWLRCEYGVMMLR